MQRTKPTGSVSSMSLASPLIGALAVALAGPCFAHHSFAMFDATKSVTLAGTVKEFQWTNPHCFIQLLVPSPDGPIEWSIEMHSPGASYREGWRPGTLPPGKPITVVINPVRDGSNGGRLLAATDPSGRPLLAKEAP